ncbi:MAG TPA: hydrogenase maturation protease [Thermoanaerobacterales bacterium]|nr:hydrogenase maturation protease [Thermoanaerobacterales bacterium]
MTASDKTTIVGVGNVLMGDDGIGVMTVRQIAGALKSDSCLYENNSSTAGIGDKGRGDVVVIEAGTDMNIVFDALIRYGYIIIVDAIIFGEAPATVHRISFDEIIKRDAGWGISLHEIGPAAALKMAWLLGERPRGFVLGIEPEKISPGVGLSPSVRRAVKNAASFLIKKIASTEGTSEKL